MGDGLKWLTLPAQMASLGEFTDFVRAGANEAALGDGEAGKIDLILEEVLVNVFRYAYPKEQPGQADVGYRVTAPGALLIQVRDSGTAYNPLVETPDPDLSLALEDRPIGGLGVFLVKQLASEVAYERKDGHNTLSILLKE